MHRNSTQWREMGDSAAREDWRNGHRDSLNESEIRSNLLGYFDTDLNDPEIVEQTDDAKDHALTVATAGYMDEYRRLGGVALATSY
jgi:hypothetical protein